MRLTSKGQMTVPTDVRKDLGVGPGSNLGLEKNEKGEFVLVNLDARGDESLSAKLARKLMEFGDRMRREGKLSGLTTDEIMEMTRGPYNDGEPEGHAGFGEESGNAALRTETESEARRAAQHMIQHMREFGRTAKRIPMTDKELMELTRGPFNDLDPH